MHTLDTCEGCGDMYGQAMTGPDGRTAFYVITRCLHRRGPEGRCEPSWHEHTAEHCREVRDIVSRTIKRNDLTLEHAEAWMRQVALLPPFTDTREAHRLVIGELDRLRKEAG